MEVESIASFNGDAPPSRESSRGLITPEATWLGHALFVRDLPGGARVYACPTCRGFYANRLPESVCPGHGVAHPDTCVCTKCDLFSVGGEGRWRPYT